MNKKIEKKKNIENLKRLTLLNILSSRGVVYRYYKFNYKKGNQSCLKLS